MIFIKHAENVGHRKDLTLHVCQLVQEAHIFSLLITLYPQTFQWLYV